LLILEITRPTTTPGKIFLKTYMRAVIPLIARLVSRSNDTARLWEYYWDTIDACIPPNTVLKALEDAGFTQVQRYVELGIFSEYTATQPNSDQ
jgi:demethylmenaquinone methyltransferase/2-methoxy-6-polyprenyl-1,4-benzoquinol methylase